jgi:hypothetical protein
MHFLPRRGETTTVKSRRASPDALHALAGTIRRERDTLDPTSPRSKPTLHEIAALPLPAPPTEQTAEAPA